MRTFWIVLVIAAIFFVGNIYLASALKERSQEVVNIIEDIEKEISKKDWEGIQSSVNALQKQWQGMAKPWKIFIEHEELDKIELSMLKVNEYARVQSEDLIRAELASLKFLVRHIYISNKLDIENVF